ncbi:MAG TPA: CpXC domain-containing protein, partial [Acidobacteriota bacterium]
MAKVQTSCPRCKSPVAAEVEQVFDLNHDPQAKQRLLSGQVNVIHCPNCGYDGMVGTPVIYHDPEKELLLTFFPSEMGLPLNEQERVIGPLINQIVNRLPLEKRKAYILRPQSMLTFQTMIEKILEGDGISRQMIDDQQKRLALLQRLLSIPTAESRLEVIKQEEALIDENFFSMFARLMEATMAQGDERSARALAAVQQELVENTEVGKKIQDQSREAQEVIKTLQEASKDGLTREKLVDIFIDSADSEVRLTTLVSLIRTGLDYTFFQLLTDKINTFENEKK